MFYKFSSTRRLALLGLSAVLLSSGCGWKSRSEKVLSVQKDDSSGSHVSFNYKDDERFSLGQHVASFRTDISAFFSLRQSNSLRIAQRFDGELSYRLSHPDWSFSLNAIVPVSREKALAVLKDVAPFVRFFDEVRIYTYTDNTGTSDVNMRISERRAEYVLSLLRDASFSDAKRVSIVPRGNVDFITTNASRDGRMENRRFELELVKYSDSLRADYGSMPSNNYGSMPSKRSSSASYKSNTRFSASASEHSKMSSSSTSGMRKKSDGAVMKSNSRSGRDW